MVKLISKINKDHYAHRDSVTKNSRWHEKLVKSIKSNEKLTCLIKLAKGLLIQSLKIAYALETKL